MTRRNFCMQRHLDHITLNAMMTYWGRHQLHIPDPDSHNLITDWLLVMNMITAFNLFYIRVSDMLPIFLANAFWHLWLIGLASPANSFLHSHLIDLQIQSISFTDFFFCKLKLRLNFFSLSVKKTIHNLSATLNRLQIPDPDVYTVTKQLTDY